MSWNVGIIIKRLNPDSTFLLQDQIGRLCYAYNRDAMVMGNLTNAILELLDITLPYRALNEAYDMQPGQSTLTVHIVSSVCGGTGAGILLDTAFDIRQLVMSHSKCDPDIVAHLILPPVFKRGYNPLAEMHYRNSYYLLKQIEYLMGANRKEDIYVQSGNEQYSELKLEETVFDMIHLTNEKINNKEITERHIARMITALAIEPIGRQINSLWDNMRAERLGKNPIQAYSCYGIKTFRPLSSSKRRRLISSAHVDGFLQFFKSLDKKLKSLDDTIIDTVQSNIVEHIYEEHKADVKLDNIIKAKEADQINEIVGKKNDDEIENTIRVKLKEIIDSGEFNLLIGLKRWVQEKKKEINNNHSALSSSFEINKTEFLKLKIRREMSVSEIQKIEADKIKRSESLRKDIQEKSKLEIYQRIIKFTERFTSLLFGSGLEHAIDSYLERTKQNKNVNDEIRSKENTSSQTWLLDLDIPDLGDLISSKITDETAWDQEYLSIAGAILEGMKNNEKINDIFNKWAADNDNGFLSSENTKERIKKQEESFYEYFDIKDLKMLGDLFEKPDLRSFLLYGPLSGSSEPELSFFQTSFGEGESGEERGYHSCYVNPNCDWILCKTILGFELNNINEFIPKYRDEYFKSMQKQPLTWITPLFNLKTENNIEPTDDNKNWPDYEEAQRIFGFTDEEIEQIKGFVTNYNTQSKKK